MRLRRLTRCEYHGLKPEVVTHTAYEQAIFEFSEARLGQFIAKGSVCEQTLVLPEINGPIPYTPFDDEPPKPCVRLRAILPKRGAHQFREIAEIADGYHYPPYGPGAEGFGFYSRETVAWMFIHNDCPVLAFKATSDENVSNVQQYLEYIEQLPIRKWPSPEQLETRELLVPALPKSFNAAAWANKQKHKSGKRHLRHR